MAEAPQQSRDSWLQLTPGSRGAPHMGSAPRHPCDDPARTQCRPSSSDGKVSGAMVALMPAAQGPVEPWFTRRQR
jgi:hypothetical protein